MEKKDISSICGKYYLLLNSDNDAGKRSECFLIKIKEIEELHDFAGYNILFDHICGSFDQIIRDPVYTGKGCRAKIGYKLASSLVARIETDLEKQLRYGEALLNVK